MYNARYLTLILRLCLAITDNVRNAINSTWSPLVNPSLKYLGIIIIILNITMIRKIIDKFLDDKQPDEYDPFKRPPDFKVARNHAVCYLLM